MINIRIAFDKIGCIVLKNIKLIIGLFLTILSLFILIIVIFDNSSYIPSKDFKESDLYIFRNISNHGKTVNIFGTISRERVFGTMESITYYRYEIDGDGNFTAYDKDVLVLSKEDIGDIGDEVLLKLRYHYEGGSDAIFDYWEVIEVKEKIVFYYQIILTIELMIVGIFFIYWEKRGKMDKKWAG